jgi:hypothetical protein
LRRLRELANQVYHAGANACTPVEVARVLDGLLSFGISEGTSEKIEASAKIVFEAAVDGGAASREITIGGLRGSEPKKLRLLCRTFADRARDLRNAQLPPQPQGNVPRPPGQPTRYASKYGADQGLTDDALDFDFAEFCTGLNPAQLIAIRAVKALAITKPA